MAMKIVIGTKSGKCFQKELSQQEAEALHGRTLGEEINGELIGISGAKFLLTGGSDSDGFPMRKDLPLAGKKKLLIRKGVGFRGKHRGKRFGGLRVKKTVAGKKIYEKTHQINVKTLKGDAAVEKNFAPAVEESAQSNE
jgi:small subunit ribosomal protein S6e